MTVTVEKLKCRNHFINYTFISYFSVYMHISLSTKIISRPGLLKYIWDWVMRKLELIRF